MYYFFENMKKYVIFMVLNHSVNTKQINKMETSFFKSNKNSTFFAISKIDGKYYYEKLYYYKTTSCEIERSGYLVDITFLVENYGLEECSRQEYFETKEKVLDVLIGGMVITTETYVSTCVIECQNFDF